MSMPAFSNEITLRSSIRLSRRCLDVVHIPAGMPHQMLVAEGDSVTYYVVKVEETR